jgi:hypothetical protein
MAITLTETIGGASSNTYATLAEAEIYMERRLQKAAWTDAEEEEKKAAMVWATRLLDEQIDWNSVVADGDQALQWPRLYLYDALGNEIEEDAIPDQLKNAEIEFAFWLLQADRLADVQSDGVGKIVIGGIEIEFQASGQPRRVVPDGVYEMVAAWGDLKFRSTGGGPKLLRV